MKQTILTNRQQYVYYNGINSELFDVTCDVPQVSVSGPFLFLIDINGISFASS